MIWSSIFLLSTLLFAGCKSSQTATVRSDHELSSKPSDLVTITIYRTGQYMAAARNWAIFVDEELVCKLSNNRYLVHHIAPGKVALAAQIGGVVLWPKKVETFEFEAESGGSYYFKTNLKSSFTRGRIELSEVTERSFKNECAECQLDNCELEED